MIQEIFDFVFVVLVYRNTRDLKEFFESLTTPNIKVIVVNSFYDLESEKEFRRIAEANNADFLSVPNKGYGAGNNRGIEYALAHYDFKYLIISNADIIIKQFDINRLDYIKNCIIAPKIINLNGKNQNPSSPYRPSKMLSRYALWCYEGNHNMLIWGYYAISRLKKIVFYSTAWYRKHIFSAHGAFVIIPYSVLKNLHPIYNERMFLFNEEEYLGMLAASKGINTIYEPNIVVLHKEDGSINIANINEFKRNKESFTVYYYTWFK